MTSPLSTKTKIQLFALHHSALGKAVRQWRAMENDYWAKLIDSKVKALGAGDYFVSANPYRKFFYVVGLGNETFSTHIEFYDSEEDAREAAVACVRLHWAQIAAVKVRDIIANWKRSVWRARLRGLGIILLFLACYYFLGGR